MEPQERRGSLTFVSDGSRTFVDVQELSLMLRKSGDAWAQENAHHAYSEVVHQAYHYLADEIASMAR